MIESLIFLSCASFLLFLLPTRFKGFFASIGWITIVAALFTELPYYFSVNNFLYPLFAVLSIPFLYVTLKHLKSNDVAIIKLSQAAAISFLIYAPFAYFEPLGTWLISRVIEQVLWVLNVLQFPADRPFWNLILRNGFRIEIILACTGIQSIAIMLGVVGGVTTSYRQKIAAFFLICPVIYLLNILRNVFVIVAYTEQWFPFLPEIASNGEYGYESFFWAHNVISEILALFVLIALAYELFVIIPQLGEWANHLYIIYRDDLQRIVKWRKDRS